MSTEHRENVNKNARLTIYKKFRHVKKFNCGSRCVLCRLHILYAEFSAISEMYKSEKKTIKHKSFTDTVQFPLFHWNALLD